ncbi:homocysteine/selenocysteine methylase (S-methylmethionine-dependent) [Pseudarthrobacter phenanthrenivorans Sphe3]|uniref:S-methylmethionine:homocysteine methyltransferase n=2 Tax=Pseudarthrobacter phenanthrenivorans TaxID=361575 RepID=F0M474_PSEPM|nr:homocysteine/selenocysteine methylase (S-methylmethionine-dependent) [Pseudarthrobacter phenanthrenivorans Sphe3]
MRIVITMSSSAPLPSLLESVGILPADGALATELEARGCNLDDPLWSAKVLLEQPHLIKEVHRDYFRAGARIATTASYQATPQGFAPRGISEQEALELVALSVRLADEARREHLAANPGAGPLLVAGSVGPYGAYLADGSEYSGDYVLSTTEFQDFHRPRITALVEAGADFLACETLPSFPEAQALLALTKEFDVESWFSFSLRDGGHISDGTPLTTVAAVLGAEPLVAAIGVNCVPLHLVTPALAALHRETDKPLVAYPNSGETYDPATKTWGQAAASGRGRDGTPATPADGAVTWRDLGARIIGGCCRTTPRDIAAVVDVLS